MGAYTCTYTCVYSIHTQKYIDTFKCQRSSFPALSQQGRDWEVPRPGAVALAAPSAGHGRRRGRPGSSETSEPLRCQRDTSLNKNYHCHTVVYLILKVFFVTMKYLDLQSSLVMAFRPFLLGQRPSFGFLEV